MSMTVTSNVQSNLVIMEPTYVLDTLVFAGAKTLAAGTILGRVTASGKLKDFVSAGSGGEEIPVAVLPVQVVATGAGDIKAQVLTGGTLRKDKLVIDADGDSSNVTLAVRDQLRDYGFQVLDVTERQIADNS